MQPSEFEILREVETLRDIRRRSTAGGPGSLILDPDLPNASSQSPTSSGYWTPSATDDSSSSSHEDSSESGLSDVADDPSHLFWVPARLHPEIAPAEFRAFLKEHARGPADGVAPAGISRSSSVSSIGGGLGRKKSMLSRQYSPAANDGIEEETVLPVRRNRTSVFSNPAPQLTISDLQKLEELAEEASQSDDPARLRNVLRRSLSLNVSPSALGQYEEELGDEADSPIIVPRPGQILRRAARTRKAGTVDGPHRFTSNRARRASTARSSKDHRNSSDRSSSDHGDQDASRRHSDESDVPQVPPLPRPDSYSEETSIYDAYASPDLDDAEPAAILYSEPDPLVEFLPPQVASHPEVLPLDFGLSLQTSTPPVLHHPQPKRALSPPAPDIVAGPLRSPSPEIVSTSASPIPPVPPLPTQRPSLHETQSYQPSTSPSPDRRDKEKDKKGLFGKWGGDKGGKKTQKEKVVEKEKDAGFFGSLFGTKKKQDETVVPPLGLGTAGRETAAALLGASKSSKSRAPSPSLTPVNGYSRYPIHVERAIYRLSHIKLANPRRPLYEQVLISNLMFWYLGVINNKAASPASPTGGAGSANASAANGTPLEKEQQAQAERERKEREDQEKAERERLEREREKQAEQKKEPRRGSLTKNGSGTTTSGTRKAEMPVRGPQYDMQHRAIEQEYGGFTQAGQPRSPSAPPTAGGHPHQQGRTPSGQHGMQPAGYSSVQLVQPQPQQAQRYYNGSANPQQGPPYPMNYSAPSLPPGAMPPVIVDQGGWMAQPGTQQSVSRAQTSPSPPPRAISPPSNPTSPRRARSPPTQLRYTPAQEKQPQPYSGGGRSPGRSLSATAVAQSAPSQVNGKLRKGQSAHAVAPQPQRRVSEEEDVPLAYYQQQRRK
ncbi:hypothetical protein EUX98_g5353 [Antrodiella citrinella]|uniref:Protein Zds1 C-terminal domain-containing protein n=1 Tax=Antrodiella citrinella TaxID=2447956 RepID=A0A4V3XIE3_9APHY|nr:hypothetical protein EUX98_g5353 [Antrodiella citrinella]